MVIASSGAPRTVLVVDDEDDVRTIVAAMVSSFGYAVLQANGGSEALRLLRSPASIDLMLTDLAMPVISGMDLAHLAVEIRPQLKVVYMSAHVRSLEGNPALRYGPLLTKPFRIDDLKAQLQERLGDPKA